MFKPNKARKYLSNFSNSKFSEPGRNYQRGYIHGYNILTGESFPEQAPTSKKTPKNISGPTKFNLEGYNLSERTSKTQYPRNINQNKILYLIKKKKI